MDPSAPSGSNSPTNSLPSSEQESVLDLKRIIGEACAFFLMMWAASRLFFRFGDYSYYFGAGYVFDVIAIIALLFLADLFTRNDRGNNDKKNSGTP